MLTTAILAWLHVFSAMMWLGGSITFGFVIAPGMAKLSQAGSAEFFLKIAPRVVRFFEITSGMTVLFGALLAYVGISNGDFPGLAWGTSWGVAISVGIALGLTSFLVGLAMVGPSLKRVVAIIGEMQSGEQQGSQEKLGKALKRTRISATADVFLLILALVFMIAAGFY
ncbi:MAG: hypothetical protein KGI26_02690 [Thaumarchaeota archaeon]|nr:hypothetical protein [Nitrososphaerota archaeon]